MFWFGQHVHRQCKWNKPSLKPFFFGGGVVLTGYDITKTALSGYCQYCSSDRLGYVTNIAQCGFRKYSRMGILQILHYPLKRSMCEANSYLRPLIYSISKVTNQVMKNTEL